MVIGATNRPDALDSALRRGGRFDREISLGIPDTAARGRILRVLAAKLKLSGEFDFTEVARQTPGFVGADLAALTKEAAMIAVHKIFIAVNDKQAQHAVAAADTTAEAGDRMDTGGAELSVEKRTAVRWVHP